MVSPSSCRSGFWPAAREDRQAFELDVGLVHADDLVGGLLLRSPRPEASLLRRTFMLSPDSEAGSMTSAAPTTSSSSWMRPSMKLWRSRAAWYSAFSDRSPWLRASAMAAMMPGRSTLFRVRSSSSRRCRPCAVIGNFCKGPYPKKPAGAARRPPSSYGEHACVEPKPGARCATARRHLPYGTSQSLQGGHSLEPVCVGGPWLQLSRRPKSSR